MKEISDINQIAVLIPMAKAVQILTEDVPYYGEWIEGEGADICLYRAMSDNRVVGAFLPVPGLDKNWEVTHDESQIGPPCDCDAAKPIKDVLRKALL